MSDDPDNPVLDASEAFALRAVVGGEARYVRGVDIYGKVETTTLPSQAKHFMAVATAEAFQARYAEAREFARVAVTTEVRARSREEALTARFEAAAAAPGGLRPIVNFGTLPVGRKFALGDPRVTWKKTSLSLAVNGKGQSHGFRQDDPVVPLPAEPEPTPADAPGALDAALAAEAGNGSALATEL